MKVRTLSIVILIGMALLGAILLMLAFPSPIPPSQIHGVTFSAPHARGIGLDWRQVFIDILDDLGVRRLRLIAYWNEIEPDDDTFDFSDLDFQMDMAAQRGAQVILSVGKKLPRWPECHEPVWAEDLSMVDQQEEVLEMIEVVVDRYRDHPALHMWQLENEPLLDFGDCPSEDLGFLAREDALLRSLDPEHLILITDSGELNSWIPAARFGDILGTTMYRTVFSDKTQDLFHYDYIFPSWLYRAKARLVGLVRGKNVLISELQGEPWGANPFTDMTREERRASLSPERLMQLSRFAERTQLPEVYWWGVEYWYWEKEVNQEPIFWETAKDFF